MIDAETIIKLVCNHYNIEPERLFMKSRKRVYCLPRQVCVYLIRMNTSLYLDKIAEVMKGNKKVAYDHSTIHYSCSVVSNLIETDCDMLYIIQSLQSDIDDIKEKAFKAKAERLEHRRKKFIEEEANRIAIASTIKHPKSVIFIRQEHLSEQEKTVAKYL
jgi:hypothetical protein